MKKNRAGFVFLDDVDKIGPLGNRCHSQARLKESVISTEET